MLAIYSQDGQKRLDAPCDDNSTQTKEVQGDNVLSLSFTLYEHIPLEVGDWCEFRGERYWLMERYRPEQKSTVEWAYSLPLYGIESLLRRFLVIDDTDGADNPVFTLTAPPREHAALIVRSIQSGMGGSLQWTVGTVEGTDNIVVDYNGTRCNDALDQVAQLMGNRAEWWFDGLTLNLCRCERGEEITLGYEKGLTALACDTADNAEFYTRLYPIGSTRNIDPERYGHTRLQLPGGVNHVDVNVEKFGVWHRFEQEAFADIYPRYTGTVSSVRSEGRTGSDGEPYTVFFFKDDALPFDPNEYELAGQVKRVSFQEGSELAGVGSEEDGTYYLEVNFDSTTREWELITIWPFGDGTQLPNDTLCPKPGDRYIPWNIRMPDEYYPLAEQEFKEAVDQYNEENALDVARYKAPTDYVYIDENGIDLYLGRRVKLESTEFFPETGYRSSRVTKITRKVNLPGQMDLEISDALSTGTRKAINQSIADVKTQIRHAEAALPDIIRSWENAVLTDSNLLSSLRTLKEIAARALSRLTDDTAAGVITFQKLQKFLQGLEAGDAVDSLLSGKGVIIDGNGRVQADRLELRGALVAMELILNEVKALAGDYSFSDAGHIESVEPLGDGTYKLYIRKETDADVTSLDTEDIVYSIVNNLKAGGTDYYTSWMRVLAKNVNENSLTVVLYPDDEVPGGTNYPPAAGYNLTRRGNTVMPDEGEPQNERAQSWLLSSREGRIMFLANVYKPISEDYNYALTLGKLPDIAALEQLPVTTDDVGLVAQTAIIENLYQMDYNGDMVTRRVPRGAWSLAVAQGDKPYRNVRHESARPTGTTYTLLEQHTVEHMGCTWGCLVDKTTDEPKWNAAGWVMLEGDPNYYLTFESTNGWQFFRGRVDTVVTALVNHGNRDITAEVMATTGTGVEWLRDSGNPVADNAWQPVLVDNAKHRLRLTAADMPVGFGQTVRVARFICRVTIPIGGVEETIENQILFK